MSIRYRKRPVVIEAIRVEDALAAFAAGASSSLPDWLATARLSGDLTVASDAIFINTLEGQMVANRADWIIQGTKGELYPCKPDIFEATYEPVVAVATMAGPSYRAFLGESPCKDPNCPCHPKPAPDGDA